MRFLVLGAGALGGYFGGKLVQGGADVEFLVRPKRAAQLAERGLVVEAHEGEIRTPVKTLRTGQLTHSYDVILLCCKAYDLDEAIAAVAPAVGAETAILPVLNGVKHVAMLADHFGRQHVLGGLTAVNATLAPTGDIVQSPLKIDMTALGELSGEVSDRCLAIQRAFAAGGMKASVSDAIMASMWLKFVGFCGIAAIATLCRSRAGAIAAAPASASFIAATIEECSRVAAAEGYPVPPTSADIVRGIFSQPGSTYGPSILVDMEAGRATEGEHTIGDLVERARRHGIGTPILTAARCNLQVYEALRASGGT
jgi:2-dehydropantoate 2-reductase